MAWWLWGVLLKNCVGFEAILGERPRLRLTSRGLLTTLGGLSLLKTKLDFYFTLIYWLVIKFILGFAPSVKGILENKLLPNLPIFAFAISSLLLSLVTTLFWFLFWAILTVLIAEGINFLTLLPSSFDDCLNLFWLLLKPIL